MNNQGYKIDETEKQKIEKESYIVAETTDAESKKERTQWGSKIEFMLASIGTAVGLGNVWRFPYLVQEHGGGAFLLVYTFGMLLIAIPIFYMELSLGQRFRKGPVSLWYKLSKPFTGLGIGSIICSWFITIYYQMIVAWCFYYLFISFSKDLPYASCPCVDGVCNVTNPVYVPECLKATPSSYYWYRTTLDITDSISESGNFNWRLFCCLLLAWTIMCCILMKGLAIWGKVSYFTTLFPYAVLLIFFIRGLTLEGAADGVKHMFTPRFSKLLTPDAWLAAFSQVFYTIGCGQGGFLAMSSYNDMHNNVRNDALVIASLNSLSSLFAGVTTSSILGYKAIKEYTHCKESLHGLNSTLCVKENFLNEVAQGPVLVFIAFTEAISTMNLCFLMVAQGPGLVFIAFTEAISTMKCPQLWSVLLFLMILTLGIGTNVGQFEPVRTTFADLKVLKIRYEFRIVLLGIASFLVGILFCQGSGQYWLQMFDTYCATYGLLAMAFCEIFIVVYIYGIDKFKEDIKFMLGQQPERYWVVCWRFIVPSCIIAITGFSLYQLIETGISYTVYNKAKGKTVPQKYPAWGFAFCVFLIISSIICIPITAVLMKLKNLTGTGANITEADQERNVTKRSQDETNI